MIRGAWETTRTGHAQTAIKSGEDFVATHIPSTAFHVMNAIEFNAQFISIQNCPELLAKTYEWC